jgi:hypothetical protein
MADMAEGGCPPIQERVEKGRLALAFASSRKAECRGQLRVQTPSESM